MEQRLKQKINNKSVLLTSIIYFGLFLLLLAPYADPDWGWHYKYGEYFFKHHALLIQNTFSWTMPNYLWVNHSWGYDILLYGLFHNLGFLGISIVSALLGVFSFYVLVCSFRLSLQQKFIAAVVFSQFTWGIFWQGLRSQVIGLFFLSLVVYILVSYGKKPQVVFFLPIIFLLWANMHGSFALGIGAVGIFLVGEIIELLIRQRKNLDRFFLPKKIIWLFSSLVFSFIATFINPFGYKIYIEAFSRLNSPLLLVVEEWRGVSIISWLGVFLIGYIGFLLFGVYKRKKAKDIPYILLVSVGAYFGFHALRFVGLFIVLSFPMFLLALEVVTYTFSRYRLFKVGFFLFFMVIMVDFGMEISQNGSILNYSYSKYCKTNTFCSEQLVRFLLKNPPKGRGFNSYGTGGYLIGRGVTGKVFIDGRMHLWQENGKSIFEDYVKIYFEGDVKTFKRYHFDWLVIEPYSILVQEVKDKKLGNWRIVYKDNYLEYLVHLD